MNYTPVHRTWLLLKITYTIAPILIGLDKLFLGSKLVDWSKYVSPLITEWIPLVTIGQIVLLSGIVELIAGIVVWFFPRVGGYLVAAWMLFVAINLVSMRMFYDIAARDVVIAMGAIALAWLSTAHD